MLEKYLVPGAIFTLPKKMDDQRSNPNGDVILYPSGSFQEMEIKTPVDTSMLAKGKTQGEAFTKRTVKYQWLPYAPGFTTEILIGGYDVITGYMSGCPLYTRMDGARRYAGHMGTVDGMPGLMTNMVTKLSPTIDDQTDMAFNPRYHWPFQHVQDCASRAGGVVRMLGLWPTERDLGPRCVMFAQAGKTNTVVEVAVADECRGNVFKQWMAGAQASLWIDR